MVEVKNVVEVGVRVENVVVVGTVVKIVVRVGVVVNSWIGGKVGVEVENVVEF
jgi:hypothetical protein